MKTNRKLQDKYTKLSNTLNYALYQTCAKVLRKHKAFQTDDVKLVERCKAAGFMVVLDFDNSTYVVAEV